MLTITHFCKHSLQYILKYSNNEQAMLGEYVKRYKSYTECSTYLNEYLENLNVMVNKIYDCHSTETVHKFNIFKLMIITWNREVLNKLNNQLVEKLVNQYDIYFTRDFHRLNLNDICFKREDSEEMDNISNMSMISGRSRKISFDLHSETGSTNISISKNSSNLSNESNDVLIKLLEM